jgi:hypothetical protein
MKYLAACLATTEAFSRSWTSYNDMQAWFENRIKFNKEYTDSDFVSQLIISPRDIGYSGESTIFKSYEEDTSYIQIYFKDMTDDTLQLDWTCIECQPYGSQTRDDDNNQIGDIITVLPIEIGRLYEYSDVDDGETTDDDIEDSDELGEDDSDQDRSDSDDIDNDGDTDEEIDPNAPVEGDDDEVTAEV